MIETLEDLTSFRWATVTQLSPLRIKLDGDTAALGLTPESLVDPLTLAVNDRVRVELTQRKVVIHGRSGGDLLSTDAGLLAFYQARPRGRNLIPNARGRVNQIGSTSGTSLALNAYFLDLWRSLTATNAVTWTGSDDTGRVITVPASEEVRAPVVEQRDVIPDDYVLVNYGTSQARVYNAGGSAPALAAATTSTPLAVALDGAANVYVEFGPGTIDRPMLVRADEWSGFFPDITYQQDLAWVQRYFWRRARLHEADPIGIASIYSTGSLHYLVMQFPVEMRATPTFSVATVGSFRAHQNGIAISNCTAIAAISTSRHAADIRFTAGAGYVNGGASVIEGSGVAGGTLDFDARL